MGMEIERKFLVKRMPEGLEQTESRPMEQAYLCLDPVVRVRRCGEEYVLTYKGAGLLAREEHNLPLTRESYRHLLEKADGIPILKRRYRVPLAPYVAELDVFAPPLAPLVLVEVEFPDEAQALAFQPPAWFGREVTYDPAYTNGSMSRHGLPEGENFTGI